VRPPPDLPGVEHRFYSLATGVRAHVVEAGLADAPALVLLHGFPQHWYCWRRVIALLAGDFRVLAMDLRGLGWSGRPDDGDFRKAAMARDAVALLDALGIERAGLLGHDWGGWAGFLAALSAPERWTGLVALGIPHPWQPRGRVLRGLPRFAYQPPLATPGLGPWLLRRTPVVSRFLAVGWGERSTFDPDAVDVFADAYRDPARAQAGSRLYRSFLVHEAGRRVGGRLTVPARLLYGRRDPLGAAFALGLERHGDDARASLLDGCGHFVPEERPEAVAAAVRELSR
jgi:pimeloyl-ACP methyl ester carboxylesterase